ncbi:MAG: ArsA family ATPase [Candidatus Heimdallarchaeota archaeon]|nr:TRC40/GET3/ArsA family transport-energizing ATPase [Candidatus Heimdallarchaeota archaeon]MCG3256709.1 ArsA family ATPase [Candidatus Heimdallarchaeota archaeon]MCK4611773.1 ArsA family ATPase [Candidatus Heimdallarchaeota archaeon]
MSLKEITSMDLKYILVGGKGGVGKTSVASALGIALAELGKRVLIISTDPAHSVSDSFDMDFSKGEITKVKGVAGDLFALEINPAAAGEEISKAIGQPVDSDQFSQFSAIPGLGELQQGLGQDLQSIPPPGMDEALSFAKILEYAEDEIYDTVILDTAPTGHTLRLLNIPEFLDSFLGRMLKMKTFISNAMTMMKSLFGGSQEKDRTVETLETMKEKVLVARDKLMDEEQTQFIKVLIPTMMSVFETERLVEELDQHLISHKFAVVNQINPANDGCSYCMHRHKEHLKNIEYIKSAFPETIITEIEALDREIRGLDMLQVFKEKLL